jgi:hypothetical protein
VYAKGAHPRERWYLLEKRDELVDAAGAGFDDHHDGT